MKVFYKDKVLEFSDKKKITREKILDLLGLNPISVLFLDKKTNSLIPITEKINNYEEIEVRSVISGG